jgi:uncharacterized repeat protein (TIGR01451 family)
MRAKPLRAKHSPRGAIAGLLVGLALIATLNAVQPGETVRAQDETPEPTEPAEETATETPEPTATATTTPTFTPTPVPNLTIDGSAGLLPEGDVNGNGVINPGDAVQYTVVVANPEGRAVGPFQVAVSYDSTFISGVTAISDGGTSDQRQIVWEVESLPSGGDQTFTFQAALRRIFPSGRTQVTGVVVIRAPGGAELQRATIPAYEVIGPNLRLVEETTELITDVDENGRLDPGDTVRFTLSYNNTGGGPSQEVRLVAALPADLTQEIVGNPDEAVVNDAALTWSLGSVPPEGEVRSVHFSVTLAPDFPSGITVYEFPVAIVGAAGPVDQRTVQTEVSGPNLIANATYEFITDQDEDGLLDPGDEVQVIVQYENIGTDEATEIQLNVQIDRGYFTVLSVDDDGDDFPDRGLLRRSIPALPAGETGTVAVSVTVRSLPPNVQELVFPLTIVSAETAPGESDITLPVDAPTPTPAPTGTGEPLIQEVRPAQGQGILGGNAVSVLIGSFLFLSLLSLAFVASRVLPGTTAERMDMDTEETAAHRQLVRELIEGVVLTAILFSVMLLGLQNALDQDSVNSIIAGIVGYVAGRVAGSH